jgi:putative membrane protein
MKATMAIGLAGAFALAACNNAQDDQTVAEATPTDLATPTAPPTPDSSTPQGFVDTAAASDMYEIEAGRLAQDMGKSDEVKAFGAMMVKDHTTSSANLKTAVAEAGNGLAVNPALTGKQQADLEQLRTAGDNFDAMYAQQQVAAHEQALALLQGQATGGTVAQLKAFAAQTAPVVEGHLGEARDLP